MDGFRRKAGETVQLSQLSSGVMTVKFASIPQRTEIFCRRLDPSLEVSPRTRAILWSSAGIVELANYDYHIGC